MCVECVPCIVEYDEMNVERIRISSRRYSREQDWRKPPKTVHSQLLPLQMTKAGSCTILSIKKLQV